MKQVALATFISAAAAINQNLAQTSAQDKKLSLAQVQALTKEEFEVVNDITDERINEYSMVIEKHAETIAYNAWTAMENDGREGLLKVCDKGEKCREEVDINLKSTITKEWEKVIEMLKASILAATSSTQAILEEGWSKKEQCELDFPCCTYGIEWQTNVKQMMITARSKMIDHYDLWAHKEIKRWELAEECNLDVDCADLGPCWDGSARLEDAQCSCPAFVAPECPETTCEDGSPVDENCACGVPDIIIDPITPPVPEKVESPTHFIYPGDPADYPYNAVCTSNTDGFFDADAFNTVTGGLDKQVKKQEKNEAQWMPTGDAIGIRCCDSANESGLVVGAEACGTGNWNDAKAYCESYGVDLCTIDQLDSLMATNAGCGHNYTLVWTLDEC